MMGLIVFFNLFTRKYVLDCLLKDKVSTLIVAFLVRVLCVTIARIAPKEQFALNDVHTFVTHDTTNY